MTAGQHSDRRQAKIPLGIQERPSLHQSGAGVDGGLACGVCNNARTSNILFQFFSLSVKLIFHMRREIRPG
jgi:hypothetical protein